METGAEVPLPISQLPGLRVLPGLWRRRCVQVWSELVTSYEPEDRDRRVQMATYADAIYRQAQRGRVKPARWSICGSLRCTPHDPLLHQVTRRTAAGGFGLRDAVVADEGHALIVLDIRSSHYWLVAGLTGDEVLLGDLEAGTLYDQAAAILEVPRDAAKIALLALVNGGGRRALSRALGIEPDATPAAKRALASRWSGLARMPLDREWRTHLGRTVAMPEDTPNHAVVGWRMQSLEADAILLALRALRHVRVVHQVHDELLIEAPEDRAEEVRIEARDALDHAIRTVAGLQPGDPDASVKARVLPSWSGAVPDRTVEDPGGELELPASAVSADGPWSPVEALRRVIDAGEKEAPKLAPDLFRSPWLPRFSAHPAELAELRRIRGCSRVADKLEGASRETAKEEGRSAREEKREARAETAPPSDKVEIRLGPEIELTAQETVAALRRLPNLFHRGGRLVVVEEDQVIELTANSLSLQMSRAARYLTWKEDDEEWVIVPPPLGIAKAVADLGHYPGVRELQAITRVPQLRPGGRVVCERGYDAESGLWYAGPRIEVPAKPTRDDAVAAVHRLRQLVRYFPFKREADFAAWLALPLTLVMRGLIDGPSPLFTFTANQARTGKSRLAVAGIRIAILAMPSVITLQTYSEAEWDKGVSSIVLGANPDAAFVDNVPRQDARHSEVAIGCATLDAILTAHGPVAIRRFGTSDMPEVRVRTVFVATSNGAQYRGDTAKRSQLVALEWDGPSPEEREFPDQPDFEAHVARHLHQLQADVLTVARAWLLAGKPMQPLPGWGGFEAWSGVVRQVLVWSGVEDPRGAAGVEELKDRDGEASDHGRLVALVRALFEDREWIASDLADLIDGVDQPTRMDGNQRRSGVAKGWTLGEIQDLAAELGVWDRSSRSVNRNLLGKTLRGAVGRPDSDGNVIRTTAKPHPRLRCKTYYVQAARSQDVDDAA